MHSDLSGPSSSEEQLAALFSIVSLQARAVAWTHSFHCAVQHGGFMVAWIMFFSKPLGLPRGASGDSGKCHLTTGMQHSTQAPCRLYARLRNLAWPRPVSSVPIPLDNSLRTTALGACSSIATVILFSVVAVETKPTHVWKSHKQFVLAGNLSTWLDSFYCSLCLIRPELSLSVDSLGQSLLRTMTRDSPAGPQKDHLEPSCLVFLLLGLKLLDLDTKLLLTPVSFINLLPPPSLSPCIETYIIQVIRHLQVPVLLWQGLFSVHTPGYTVQELLGSSYLHFPLPLGRVGTHMLHLAFMWILGTGTWFLMVV